MGISTAGQKSICVPTTSEADYQAIVRKGTTFRTYLDLPTAAESGFINHWWTNYSYHLSEVSNR